RRRRIRRHRVRSLLLSCRPAGEGAEILDDLLPAGTHVRKRGVVSRRDEAGMDKVKACSTVHPGQGEGDDGVEWRAVSDIALVSGLPAIDQAFVRDRLQYLAVDGAVP